MTRLLIAVSALAMAAPAWAETLTVEAGEGAQERLQEALILAAPGDEVVLAAGRFVLTDGISLDVDNVTVRGAGMDATILDFTTQAGAGEGFLITSDGVTVRDFALENPKGDGVKSKGADDIVYHRIRVTWTGGPDAGNGAYGVYPVESSNILIDGVQVSGASDAGIYVGQSTNITVRNSIAEANVAGIEIENSRNALVEGNVTTRNTGGILVFDLPNLPVMGGGNVVIRRNLVVDNDTANFAPPGNIVASVRRGSGILVMANENVLIEDNFVTDNPTAGAMVVTYSQPFEDERYNPYGDRPERVFPQWRRSATGRCGYAAGGVWRNFAARDVGRAAAGGYRFESRRGYGGLVTWVYAARPDGCGGRSFTAFRAPTGWHRVGRDGHGRII